MILMQQIKHRFTDPTWITGMALILFSFGFYCIPFLTGFNTTDSPAFMLNAGATALFVIIRFINRKDRPAGERSNTIFLLLTLFLISAFSLNRELTVFQDSVDWFSALLVLSCVNYIAFSFFEAMPTWARHLLTFINGISLVIFLYLALYLIPVYAFGILGAILFGIGLHAFVPILFVYFGLKLQANLSKENSNYWKSYLAGVTTSLMSIAIFAGLWNSEKQKIQQVLNDSAKQTELFSWVYSSQHIPVNNLTGKILRTSLVYTAPNFDGSNFFWNIPAMNMGEKKKHDPLIVICELFSPKLSLTQEDRFKILQSKFQLRHETTERLWAGDHLSTSLVNTSVRLWPQCNISYTEKTITIENRNLGSWRIQEEAIYTFYLPEGGVVSSLSLWIDGKEEKGYLTTRAKAAEAYNTIVGVQRRDPSVVHWQEGNMVSVKVFPVIAGQSRMFKIGITSPVERVNGKLRYTNIPFKGPDWSDCDEEIQVDFEQPVRDFKLPGSFVSMPNRQSYSRKGSYQPAWSLVVNDPGLSECTFSFGGFNYSLSPYHQQLVPAIMDDLYLDINKSWSRTEFDQALQYSQGRKVFAYTDTLEPINEYNKEQIWNKLKELEFSLFPFYRIKNPERALVVTKCDANTPNFDDLKETVFINKTRGFLSTGTPIKLLNLDSKRTSYLSFLKELRALQYEEGDLAILRSRLEKGNFPLTEENDDRIVIHDAELVISRKPGEGSNGGPDHIMRLFSYNHILFRLGKDYVLDRPIEDSIVNEAAQANVVSPVSSLVVLEKQEDYDKFDLKKNKNSLGNASLGSKGAVPEPHEWVLIILVAITLLWLSFRHKIRLGVK